MKRAHFIDAAACALLCAVVWLLYGRVLRLWWTYDDAFLIHIAATRRWWEYFVASDVWRTMPQRLFTPLLTASYDSELSLFDLHSGRWYVLHLLWIAIAAVSFFAVLRLWLSPMFA